MTATKDNRARIVSMFCEIGICALLLVQFQGLVFIYLLFGTIV